MPRPELARDHERCVKRWRHVKVFVNRIEEKAHLRSIVNLALLNSPRRFLLPILTRKDPLDLALFVPHDRQFHLDFSEKQFAFTRGQDLVFGVTHLPEKLFTLSTEGECLTAWNFKLILTGYGVPNLVFELNGFENFG